MASGSERKPLSPKFYIFLLIHLILNEMLTRFGELLAKFDQPLHTKTVKLYETDFAFRIITFGAECGAGEKRRIILFTRSQ